MIEKILEKYKLNENFDFADEDVQERVLKAAEELKILGLKRLKEFDEKAKDLPILLALAIKIAISKIVVENIKENYELFVVFPVYKEQNRIKKRTEHPHGEDFLNVKYKQMKWLFENSKFDWQLVVVDDGCPFGSGKLAEEIIKKEKLDRIKVLYLKDHLNEEPVKLKSTDESKKGGSVLLGIHYAIKSAKNLNKTIVVYTDADISTHLGQIGYLIEDILKGKKMVIGSRREGNSNVIKKGKRNFRGKLFIYFWKKMLPIIDFINDTQCAFKAIRGDLAKEIIYNNIEKQFAFDVELILKAALKDKGGISVKGIVWIDSEKESNTKGSDLYLDMLKKIAEMALKYTKPNNDQMRYINLIKNMTKEDWEKLINNIPKEIIETDPKEFNKLDLFDKIVNVLN